MEDRRQVFLCLNIKFPHKRNVSLNLSEESLLRAEYFSFSLPPTELNEDECNAHTQGKGPWSNKELELNKDE